jgi:antibiotic biosynthesis monooxygenase (ABM) superfamily enzyme
MSLPSKAPRWKMAVLTWVGIFPLATAVLAIAEPALAELPLVARTFALTAVLAPSMVFVIMPVLTATCASWLQPLTKNHEP